jgi:hypothetical protein
LLRFGCQPNQDMGVEQDHRYPSGQSSEDRGAVGSPTNAAPRSTASVMSGSEWDRSVRESQQHGTWSRSRSRSPVLLQSTPRREECVVSHDRNAPRRSVRAWRGVEK